MNKKTLQFFLAACWSVLAVLPAFLGAQTDSCLACHRELDDDPRSPALAFAQDVHQKIGLSCSDCHGGNRSREDMESAKDRTFRGTPKRADIPRLCGSCHSDAAFIRSFNPNLRTDQLSLYGTSQHGLALKKGDDKVAVCTDCHGVHGILPASVPKSMTFPWNIPQTCGRCHADQATMSGYRLPTDQLAGWKESVHARALLDKKDLSAPTCNDCHGNHGAAPPEVSSIAYVCRQCHPATGDLFIKSPHKKVFDEAGFSECEACHGQHKILPPTDEMLGTGKESVCLECHAAGDKGYETAAGLKEMLDSFVARHRQAGALLERARRQGVAVEEPAFLLKDADMALVMLRNLTHTLSLADVSEKAAEGEKILDEVMAKGRGALGEGRFRRLGLVVATSFLLLLAAALFLKVRRLKTRRGGGGTGTPR